MSFEEMLAVITIAIVGGCLMFPVFRGLGRRLEGRGSPDATAVPTAAMKRLERMEQAIEAVAVEVERISEGQRFVTRALAVRERESLRQPVERR